MQEELIAYVQDQLERNVTREDITQTLKDVGGWTDDDISEVFIMLDEKHKHEQSIMPAPSSVSTPQSSPQASVEPLLQQTNTASETTSQQVHNETKPTHTATKHSHGLMISIIVFILILLSLGGFAVYRYLLPSSQPETTTEIKETSALIERDGMYFVRGHIILPAGVALPTKITSSPTAPFASSPVALDGSFEIPITPDAVNKIMASAPDKEFSYIAIVLPEDIQKKPFVRVDISSTALSLVFLDARITSSNPTEATALMSIITADKNLPLFSETLSAVLATSTQPLSDQTLNTSLQHVVESVLTTKQNQ